MEVSHFGDHEGAWTLHAAFHLRSCEKRLLLYTTNRQKRDNPGRPGELAMLRLHVGIKVVLLSSSFNFNLIIIFLTFPSFFPGRIW
jgi:hypothetical protein